MPRSCVKENLISACGCTLCAFRRGDNANDLGGGILFTNGGLVSVTQNSSYRNSAISGAGIAMFSGAADVIGNVIDTNRASAPGGRIANSSRAYLKIVNNTFDVCVGSHDGVGDGGGALGGDVSVVGLVEVDYNCIWNTTPADYYRFVPGAHSLSADPQYCDPPAQRTAI